MSSETLTPLTPAEIVGASWTPDLERLRGYRLARVREQLARRDYAALVLFDPINIRYAADSRNMAVWTMHNAVRYLFIPVSGPVVLFDFHGCGHLSRRLATIDEIRPALAWDYFSTGPRRADAARHWAAEVADLVQAHSGGNRRLALDHCDVAGAAALAARRLTLHDGQEIMEQARVIKSQDEILLMSRALASCEAGMRAMQQAMRPGMTENELWAILHAENIARGGEWIETRLLSSGPRTNPWFQECSDRVLEEGDLVCFDTDLIGAHGYCADISRAWRVGGGRPSDEQRRLYALALEQLEYNRSLLRPGVALREVVERSWPIPDPYVGGRYSCLAHGVGLCDEYPLIPLAQDFERSGYDGTIEENMTLCVESYIGASDGREGVKLEQQVLITAAGAQLLSSYPLEEEFL